MIALSAPKSIAELERKLKYHFADESLIKRAITHPSFNKVIGENYERLEFLGDRVMGLLAGKKIYGAFPNKDEGVMTAIITQVVRNDIFAQMAGILDLRSFILWDQRGGIMLDKQVLADVFEALAAAIFLDGGWGAVEKTFGIFFSADNLALILKNNQQVKQSLLEKTVKVKKLKTDPVKILRQIANSKYGILPIYQIVGQRAIAGKKTYLVNIHFDGIPIGAGTGRSVIEANVNAAKNTLEKTDRLEKLPASFLKKRSSF